MKVLNIGKENRTVKTVLLAKLKDGRTFVVRDFDEQTVSVSSGTGTIMMPARNVKLFMCVKAT